MEKNKSLVIVLILSILVIGACVYLSYPFWQKWFFSSPDTENNEAKSSCEKDGGNWFGLHECRGENCGMCAHKTTDYGNKCNTKSDCQGLCEATTKTANETVGTCTEYDRFTGGSIQLYNNGVINTLTE